jgi:hypothetical protein
MFLLEPPVPVQGFPIEIVAISPGKTPTFLWEVGARIRVGEEFREASLILSSDRRVIICKMPPGCVDSFRALTGARGHSPERSPLADAIEAAASAHPASASTPPSGA